MATKMFQGRDNHAEEMAEAKALQSGRITKAQYMAGEKSEGHHSAGEIRGNANALASGAMSASEYAGHSLMRQTAGFRAPNSSDGCGPVRSIQDYKK